MTLISCTLPDERYGRYFKKQGHFENQGPGSSLFERTFHLALNYEPGYCEVDGSCRALSRALVFVDGFSLGTASVCRASLFGDMLFALILAQILISDL